VDAAGVRVGALPRRDELRFCASAMSSSATVFIAGLRSAVEGVGRARGLRARVEHTVNARGELVVALLAAADVDVEVQDRVRADLDELASRATRSSARRIIWRSTRSAGSHLEPDHSGWR